MTVRLLVILGFFVASTVMSGGAAYASLITTTAPGDLMFEYLGGEAGPSLLEFGIGTPESSSSLADRNMVFVIDYYRSPTPQPIVNNGYFGSGSQLDFYNLSNYNGNLFSFSSRLLSSPRNSDLATFTDTDNSLRLGGSVVESIGSNMWILHLDDAWSYMYDDDDNEMLIKVWIAPTAGIPEPNTWLLLMAGLSILLCQPWLRTAIKIATSAPSKQQPCRQVLSGAGQGRY
ncbi:MAG: hypothetical protein ABTQ26_12290 [Azonexus sp.]